MGKIVERPETGKLFFDFRYGDRRCREQTALDNTPANRRKLESILKKIEAEITLGTFEYHRYFPNSARATEFTRQAQVERANAVHDTPLFGTFAETWLDEMRIQWRRSYIATSGRRRLAASPRKTFSISGPHSPKLQPGTKSVFQRVVSTES